MNNGWAVPPLPQSMSYAQGLATFGPPVLHPHTSPTSTLSSDGTVEPPRPLPNALQSSVVVTFDSRDRDRATNPSASSFRLALPFVLKNVRSIELVEAIIPAVAVPSYIGSTTHEPYVVLKCKDVNVSTSAESATADAKRYSNPVSQEAFGHFYIADAVELGHTYTRWARNAEHRMVKQFAKPLSTLVSFDFSLWMRGADTAAFHYPLSNEQPPAIPDPAQNVFLKFEIVCE
jgi:hypothetical protein